MHREDSLIPPTRQYVTLLRPTAETAANLQRIAAMNNVPLATALEQAILNEEFIEEQTAAGAKLLIEKNGSLHELVFRPALAA